VQPSAAPKIPFNEGSLEKGIWEKNRKILLNKLSGGARIMSASAPSSSSRRAQGIRKALSLKVKQAIQFRFRLSSLPESPDDISSSLCCALARATSSRALPSTVIQCISVIHGSDIELSVSNVFEIDLLCDERSMTGKWLRQKIAGFMEHPWSGESLLLRRLLFRLSRGMFTSEAEDSLHSDLVSFVGD
jgi:hypothetical protein